MITRYTTPYHNFILPFRVDLVDSLYITYSQNKKILFERTYPDNEHPDTTFINVGDFLDNASMGDEYGQAIKEMSDENSSLLTLHLTQEETSLFTHYDAEEKNIGCIDIRAKDKSGEAFTSHSIRDRIYGSVKEDEI